MKDLHRHADGRVLRIGHRGAAALEPENTLASFRRSIELGVDFVEFDVLDHPDDRLVIAHSREAVGAQPLTLEDALEFFARTDVGLHVDVKCGRHGREVAAALRRHGLVERSVASSFWSRALRELRAEEPDLRVGITYPEDRRGLARRRLLAPLVPAVVRALARAVPRRLPRWLRRTGASSAMLHHEVLSPAAVAACHARGAALWTWTVNDRAVLDRVVALGVDGVISDDPRLFLQ